MGKDRQIDGVPGRASDLPTQAGGGWLVFSSTMIFVAGVWLLLAPTLLAYSDSGIDAASWNDRTVGPLIAIIAVLGMVWPRDTIVFSVINVVLGCWLIAAPLALGYDDAPAAQRNALIVGAAIAVFAAGSAWADRQARRR